MKVNTGVAGQTFENGERKVINLYIEGDYENSVDKHVLESIFEGHFKEVAIDYKTMGFCTNVIAASEVLYKENKNNYFIIDRDHHDDSTVNESWTVKKNNLIIWKRRHIENYFLDADFLSQSQYLKNSITKLKLEQQILNIAKKRLFMDIANMVIISIREDMKKKWIECFTNPDEFDTEVNSMEKLLRKHELECFKSKVNQKLSSDYIKDKFYYYKQQFVGEEPTVQFGKGEWLKLMIGKPILHQIVNSNYEVRKIDGTNAQGDGKQLKVIKDLFKMNSEDKWPEDFRNLKKIVLETII